MPNSLELELANPPKCPSCRDVAMERVEIERNEFIEGGAIRWGCPRCGLRLVRTFE